MMLWFSESLEGVPIVAIILYQGRIKRREHATACGQKPKWAVEFTGKVQ